MFTLPGLTVAETINLIVAIVSMFGVITSLLLWVTTHQSLREIRRQNENQARSMKNEVIHQITTSHQNIFLSVLSSTKLTTPFLNGETEENFVANMLSTLLINHCSAVHLYAMQNSLEHDDWLGLQNDIIDLFDWPIIKKRWPQVRTFYSQEFQEFIDTLTIKGRRFDEMPKPRTHPG